MGVALFKDPRQALGLWEVVGSVEGEAPGTGGATALSSPRSPMRRPGNRDSRRTSKGCKPQMSFPLCVHLPLESTNVLERTQIRRDEGSFWSQPSRFLVLEPCNCHVNSVDLFPPTAALCLWQTWLMGPVLSLDAHDHSLRTSPDAGFGAGAVDGEA